MCGWFYEKSPISPWFCIFIEYIIKKIFKKMIDTFNKMTLLIIPNLKEGSNMIEFI